LRERHRDGHAHKGTDIQSTDKESEGQQWKAQLRGLEDIARAFRIFREEGTSIECKVTNQVIFS